MLVEECAPPTPERLPVSDDVDVECGRESDSREAVLSVPSTESACDDAIDDEEDAWMGLTKVDTSATTSATTCAGLRHSKSGRKRPAKEEMELLNTNTSSPNCCAVEGGAFSDAACCAAGFAEVEEDGPKPLERVTRLVGDRGVDKVPRGPCANDHESVTARGRGGREVEEKVEELDTFSTGEEDLVMDLRRVCITCASCATAMAEAELEVDALDDEENAHQPRSSPCMKRERPCPWPEAARLESTWEGMRLVEHSCI